MNALVKFIIALLILVGLAIGGFFGYKKWGTYSQYKLVDVTKDIDNLEVGWSPGILGKIKMGLYSIPDVTGIPAIAKMGAATYTGYYSFTDNKFYGSSPYIPSGDDDVPQNDPTKTVTIENAADLKEGMTVFVVLPRADKPTYDVVETATSFGDDTICLGTDDNSMGIYGYDDDTKCYLPGGSSGAKINPLTSFSFI